MCPNCQAASPRIAGKTRPGFCFQCNQWLGETEVVQSDSSFSTAKTDILENDILVATLAGKLLATTLGSTAPTGKPIAKALKEARKLNRTPDGVCMYRTLGILGSTYNTWINPGNKPSLLSVLDRCIKLNVSPVELLTRGTFGNMKFWKRVRLLPKPEREKTRERRVLDISHIRQRLELIASCKGTPLTLMQVSRSEQVEHSILRRHFPDLCKKITHRARLDRTNRSLQNQEAKIREIESVVKKLHKDGVAPTFSRVASLLKRPGMMLSPVYRLALRKARATLH